MSNQVTLLATPEILCDQSIGYECVHPEKNDRLRRNGMDRHLVAEILDCCREVAELLEVLSAEASHGSYVHLCS